MTWEEKVKKYGRPTPGKVYTCTVKHFGTGKEVIENLKFSRGVWKTADDGSELDEWNWDVVSWTLK